jgi:diguanylate cyclase (GGDEF)-like protein
MSVHILLVDDDLGAIQLLGRILVDIAHVHVATSGEAALRLARATPPDLILLDAEMPGMNGFEVCEALKADEALADVPVIFVSSHSSPDFEMSGFDVGAADFIAKPVNAQLVLARVTAQLRGKRMADELRRIATVDVLTGVANRRRFDEVLEREWRRARRQCDPMALLMIDIDHFKAYNDQLGHQAGDACLRAVAQALALATTRPADLVARFGGDEFAVLLPQTRREGAAHMAEAMLDAVRALGLRYPGPVTAGRATLPIMVTVSIGLGCYDQLSSWWITKPTDSRFADHIDGHDPARAADLLRAADQALYAAKHAGRGVVRAQDIDEALPPP